ncbi:MAG: lipoprotein [Gammaproteobacteria bacterium]|nr:lipoprotein [Gammaproteobacteria bacterium]
MNRPRYLLWILLPIALVVSLLGGCGQKGDLYLPDEPRDQSAVGIETAERPA